MKARITFRSEIILNGENIKDIKNQFESMVLFAITESKNPVKFIEISSVEDAETFKDIRHEYEEA